MSNTTPVELWLLDSTYKLACPTSREAELKHAGELLEQKFRDMRGQNPRMDNQKIAVLVSLQLMQDVLDLNKTLQQYSTCERQLAELIDKVDQQVNEIME